jgi:hypothetical protein
MKSSTLILGWVTACALQAWGGTSTVAINNPSFEANRSTSVTGAFGQGDLQDLGLTSPTGWSVVATDNTAASNNGQEIAFGWLNLTPAEPGFGPPQPQALSLMAGAAIGQVTDLSWSSLMVGDVLTLSIAAGDRDVNSPDGTPRWADEAFFGLSEGLATRAGSTPGDSASGWISNMVARLTVATPPDGYKSGFMSDVVLTHVVTAADVARSGNVGVFIASVGDRDGTGNGVTSTGRQSFWDHVRLDLATSRPTVEYLTLTPSAVSRGGIATLEWYVSGAEWIAFDQGIGEVWSVGSQLVSPMVTTTYTMTATNSFGTTTRAVTLTVVPPGPYRYYRFAPTDLRNADSANSVQISEFQMLFDGNRIEGATASNPGGNSPGGEGPQQGNDNDVGSKWLDFTKFTPLVLDFGVTTDVNGYRLATANDGEERDPVSWRIEGSHDNVNWMVIDEQTGHPTPTERSVYLDDFILPPFSTGPVVTFTANPAVILQGATSKLTWNVADADSIAITPGLGTVGASGSANVSPASTTTYTLTAVNVNGTTIRAVTLTVIPPGPYRHYRFVPTKNRAGGTPPGLLGEDFQIAEFQLLLDGQWVQCPMNGVTCPGASRSVDDGEGAKKANDNRPVFVAAGQAGDTSQGDSKWNDSGMPPLQYDFAATQDVTGYRICTANDSENRDPVSWRVEGSHDGVHWVLLDEKKDYPITTSRNTYVGDFSIPLFGNRPRVTFTATPATIVVGRSSTLAWSVSNAASIAIDQGIGTVAANGSTTVSPATTTTYTLTATNAEGSTVKTVTVRVGLGLPVAYDFDDATFQGWTDVSLGDTRTQGWSPITGHGGTQSGPNAIRAQYHDSMHPTMILRSPEFTLNGSGDLSAWIGGGDGIGSLAGTAVTALQANSTDQGFMGIALRNKNNGQYLLSARKSSDGDSYQKLVFTAAQLAALDQNATYTLDLVDACHGGWGWAAMDTVTIPGNLGSGPTNLPVILSFTAAPSPIILGQPSTLAWNVSNATSVSIDNGVGSVATTGHRSVTPVITTTYTLAATGAGGSSTATATVTVFQGALSGRTYDTIAGDSYLEPISNLIAQTPDGLFEQLGEIAYEDDFVGQPDLPGITGANDFCILWQGWFDVRIDGQGNYTFGTESDDGSVIYLDLNEDGDFDDPGELVVNNNGMHPKFTQTGTVELQMDEVRVAIGFYQAGGGAAMYARFARGEDLPYASLSPIHGGGGYFKATNSLPLRPAVTFVANPSGILSGQSSTLAWVVNNATSVTIDNGIGVVASSGSIEVSPAGTTTYTLSATGPGGTRTRTATVTLVAPGPYRFYRFVPTALRDAGAANSVQLAEFQMLAGGVRVGGAAASNPGGDSHDNESPAQANDNDLDTKWLDFAKFTPLVLDFGAATAVDAYRWATANDAEERDPVSWRVEGSHDGAGWVMLHQQSDYSTPTARKTWLRDFSLTAIPPFAVTLVSMAPTAVTLTWESVPFAAYDIESSANVADPNAWSMVAQNIPSGGATTTQSVPRGSEPLRFYRVTARP